MRHEVISLQIPHVTSGQATICGFCATVVTVLAFMSKAITHSGTDESNSLYLASHDYTTADISVFALVHLSIDAGISMNTFSNVPGLTGRAAPWTANGCPAHQYDNARLVDGEHQLVRIKASQLNIFSD